MKRLALFRNCYRAQCFETARLSLGKMGLASHPPTHHIFRCEKVRCVEKGTYLKSTGSQDFSPPINRLNLAGPRWFVFVDGHSGRSTNMWCMGGINGNTNEIIKQLGVFLLHNFPSWSEDYSEEISRFIFSFRTKKIPRAWDDCKNWRHLGTVLELTTT